MPPHSSEEHGEARKDMCKEVVDKLKEAAPFMSHNELESLEKFFREAKERRIQELYKKHNIGIGFFNLNGVRKLFLRK